ncbi:DAR GTPase 2, mitochondrial isoform X1 [Primulina eburnea]|uniref:DAR GTPase 2, mitochondrial isoform X1 n=1 Tax=Primulina eburnea TaxID=1245227 RepID=UPI003C6C0BE3
MMAATASLIQKIGEAVKQVAANRGSDWWYTPHMAAASRAIAERLPLVDIILEVRDSRIPWSSEYGQLRKLTPSARHIIVLNKKDLANRYQTKEWLRFLKEHNCSSFAVNSHNKENVQEFLNFIQARVKEMNKMDHHLANTISLMLVGIPNVGKSALANALHQVGRITAAEKGKLKHSIVSPQPGETKCISSLKIASHPNVYVLDTPGILPSKINDDWVCSKLALTGAIKDSAVGEIELVQYFLSILNSSDEYTKWGKLSGIEIGGLSSEGGTDLDKRRKKQYPTDHTQDFIVNNVRRTLFEAISSFKGDLENRKDMARLMEEEFKLLLKVFHLPLESEEETNCKRVATKLLNLFRTGRLGHYTLDSIPSKALSISF